MATTIQSKIMKCPNIEIKDLLIDKIKQAYDRYKNKENLTYSKFVGNAFGRPFQSRLKDEFGSVENALIAAEIPLKKNEKLSHRHDIRYSDEQLIAILQDAAKFFGHPPMSTEYNKWEKKTASVKIFQEHFGSWNKAIVAANMEPKRFKYFTKEQLINSIKCAKENIGHTPLEKEYNEYKDRICYSAVIVKTFGSWNKALIAAGMKPKTMKQIIKELHAAKRKVKKERIHNGYLEEKKQNMLANICTVINDLGHVPSRREYNKHPMHTYNAGTIAVYLKSWTNAVKQAGFQAKHGGGYSEHFNSTREREMIQNLRMAAEVFMRSPSTVKYMNWPDRQFTVSTYTRHYGSWENALKTAGLEPVSLLQCSDEQLLIDLYDTAIENPQISSIRALCTKARHAPALYVKRFGNYENVKKLLYLEFGIKIQSKLRMKDNIITYKKHLIQGIQDYYKENQQILKFSECIEIYPFITHFLRITKMRYADLTYQAIGISYRTNPRYINDEEIITDVKKAARYFKHIPKKYEYDQYPKKIIQSQQITKRFGSWNDVLIAAGFKPIRCYRISTQEILDGLCQFIKNIGYIPRPKEYYKHKLRPCSYSVIQKHFGSWNNALIAAGLKEESVH